MVIPIDVAQGRHVVDHPVLLLVVERKIAADDLREAGVGRTQVGHRRPILPRRRLAARMKFCAQQ